MNLKTRVEAVGCMQKDVEKREERLYELSKMLPDKEGFELLKLHDDIKRKENIINELIEKSMPEIEPILERVLGAMDEMQEGEQ